jgi:hypothetical protein
MEDLHSDVVHLNEVKDLNIAQQQEELRNWLHTHASDEVSGKFDQRHKDSVLLRQLKYGLRAERRRRQELENSLLYAGVDTHSCHEIIDCGDSLSECLMAVNHVSFKHESELKRLQDSVAYIDKKSNHQLAAGLNPATVITEFRRHLIFHALMGSDDFHVKREHAAGILDKHSQRDPKPKRKINLKVKPVKHQFLSDSLDHLLAIDEHADFRKVSADLGSPGASCKLRNRKMMSSKSTKGATSAKVSNKEEATSSKLTLSAEEREQNGSITLRQAQQIQLDDEDVDEFEYSGNTEEDTILMREHMKERRKMMKIKNTAFRTTQAFKPEWGSYDVMRSRWKSGGVRPTLSHLNINK